MASLSVRLLKNNPPTVGVVSRDSGVTLSADQSSSVRSAVLPGPHQRTRPLDIDPSSPSMLVKSLIISLQEHSSRSHLTVRMTAPPH